MITQSLRQGALYGRGVTSIPGRLDRTTIGITAVRFALHRGSCSGTVERHVEVEIGIILPAREGRRERRRYGASRRRGSYRIAIRDQPTLQADGAIDDHHKSFDPLFLLLAPEDGELSLHTWVEQAHEVSIAPAEHPTEVGDDEIARTYDDRRGRVRWCDSSPGTGILGCPARPGLHRGLVSIATRFVAPHAVRQLVRPRLACFVGAFEQRRDLLLHRWVLHVGGETVLERLISTCQDRFMPLAAWVQCPAQQRRIFADGKQEGAIFRRRLGRIAALEEMPVEGYTSALLEGLAILLLGGSQLQQQQHIVDTGNRGVGLRRKGRARF